MMKKIGAYGGVGEGGDDTQTSKSRRHMAQLSSWSGGDQELGDTLGGQ